MKPQSVKIKKSWTIKKILLLLLVSAFFIFLGLGLIFVQEASSVSLGNTLSNRNAPSILTLLREGLHERISLRRFQSQELSTNNISKILEAAFSTKHPDFKKETILTDNKAGITIYIITTNGLFRYDHIKKALQRLESVTTIPTPIRRLPTLKRGTAYLIYVDHSLKNTGTSSGDKLLYQTSIASLMSQNIFLFCTSEGLKASTIKFFKKTLMADLLGLKSSEAILMVQIIGYPK